MRNSRFAAFLFLSSVLFVSPIIAESYFPNCVASLHAVTVANGDPPILIDSDTSFAANALLYGWSGSGNATHPYIIEFLSIDLLGAQGACISISDTTVYFIIRNCDLTGATWDIQGAGVFLDNVVNGVISENTLHGDESGVWFEYCSDITVINNTMNSNERSGVYLYLSNSITFNNNIIDSSMFILCSGSNTFINNSLTGGGLDIIGNDVLEYSQTLVSDNLVNGKPMIFWQDQVGGTVPTGAGQVILVNCYGVTVEDQIIDSATNGICAYYSDDIILTNNTLTGNYCGIHTDSTTNLVIYDNNCTANAHWGMGLKSVYYAEIYDNFCNDQISALGAGIYLIYAYSWSSSLHLMVHNNTCTGNNYGIQLYSGTTYGLVADNNCSYNNYGIYINDGHDNTIRDNIVVGNTIQGVFTFISYDNLITKNYILNSGVGISLSNSHTTDVINNIIKAPVLGSSIGVHISHGNSHTVSDNDIEATTYAIFIESSVNNTLSHNNLTGNAFSIYSQESNNTDINNNYLVAGSFTGLFLDDFSYNTNVTWNIFVECNSNAFDDSTNAFIDYNYWSDYTGSDGNGNGIGDTFHPIPGSASNADWHPLYYIPEAPTWVEEPEDQYLEVGEGLSYDLNATVNTLFGGWSIGDVVYFSIDVEGVVTNATFLAAGEYNLEVHATDIYGIALIGTFTVYVDDTTDPKWIVVPENQILDYGQTLVYQLEATDLSGIATWTVNNTDFFSITGSGLLSNNALLTPGVYHLLVTATDPYGNFISATIDVLVNAPSTTTTTSTETTTSATTSTTASTTPEPPSGFDPLITIVVIGAGGVVIIIIIIVIVRKKP